VCETRGGGGNVEIAETQWGASRGGQHTNGVRMPTTKMESKKRENGIHRNWGGGSHALEAMCKKDAHGLCGQEKKIRHQNN
jgi:hypothetical protein